MKKKVLIIDDDFEIVNLLKLALENNQFEIIACYSADEVKRLIEKGFDVDVILLDYFLPHVDGISIAKILLEANIQAPVVFFTASDTDFLPEKMPENVIETVKKPFSIDNIIETLNRLIRIKRFLLHQSVENNFRKINVNQITSYPKELQDIIFTEKAISYKMILSKLSHGIKNSLQTILNYTELLEKGYIEDADKQRFFDTIRKKAEEIRSALDILRRPEITIFEENFSLKNVIKKALEDLKPRLKEKDVYIKLNFQKNLPLYFGYRMNFLTFFENLIGKSVECFENKGQLLISVYLHQQEYIIEIKLDGIVPFCENKLHFFDPSQNEVEGFEMTKAILALKDMGGKIQIEDIEKGIIYHIQLPMRSPNV
ncbi:MAG: response regulator [Proteobacteria bacterium]|nr:response regulator [Pseudomonadota bacterium]